MTSSELTPMDPVDPSRVRLFISRGCGCCHNTTEAPDAFRPNRVYNFSMRTIGLLALALALAPFARPQCNPSPAVQTAIDALPSQDATETDWQFQQRQDAALRDLAARYPGNLFVQRTVISNAWKKQDKDRVIAEYKALYEKTPGDPVTAYLYGTALEGRKSAESIKLFQAALAKSPEFPWPHIGLAGIYSTPVFLNKRRRPASRQSFLGGLPG